jgi:hypothetical protein
VGCGLWGVACGRVSVHAGTGLACGEVLAGLGFGVVRLVWLVCPTDLAGLPSGALKGQVGNGMQVVAGRV